MLLSKKISSLIIVWIYWKKSNFTSQYTKLKLGHKRLYITIVLYEASHYFPVSKDYQWLCYFQCIISFGIQVIISYLAMIYTYIALIMFIKPNIINSKFNKFFINISPGLFFIGIIFYILYVPKLFIYFQLNQFLSLLFLNL